MTILFIILAVTFVCLLVAFFEPIVILVMMMLIYHLFNKRSGLADRIAHTHARYRAILKAANSEDFDE